jgi:hypothetical protein
LGWIRRVGTFNNSKINFSHHFLFNVRTMKLTFFMCGSCKSAGCEVVTWYLLFFEWISMETKQNSQWRFVLFFWNCINTNTSSIKLFRVRWLKKKGFSHISINLNVAHFWSAQRSRVGVPTYIFTTHNSWHIHRYTDWVPDDLKFWFKDRLGFNAVDV